MFAILTNVYHYINRNFNKIWALPPFFKIYNILYMYRERSGSVVPRGRGFESHRRRCVVVLEQDTFILA